MARNVLAVGLLSVAVAGGAGVVVAAGVDETAPSPAVEFPINENGLTYGSGLDTDVGLDLIEAYATNGELGYVRATDLNQDLAADPAEALSQDVAGHRIPIYAVDGTTVIGEFVVDVGVESYEPGS